MKCSLCVRFCDKALSNVEGAGARIMPEVIEK